MAERGIDNGPDLLARFADAEAAAEAVLGACRWHDHRKQRSKVGPGLLAKKIRDGGMPGFGQQPAHADQHRVALERANEVKNHRVVFRMELRAASRPEAAAILADAIDTVPDYLAGVDVDVLLQWCPGVGSEVVERWLQAADITEKRTLGVFTREHARPITERQRQVLSELLRKRARQNVKGGNEGEGS